MPASSIDSHTFGDMFSAGRTFNGIAYYDPATRPVYTAAPDAIRRGDGTKQKSRVVTQHRRDQCVESFEGQLAILCSHLTAKVTLPFQQRGMHEYGIAGEDPIKVAKALSKVMDEPRRD